MKAATLCARGVHQRLKRNERRAGQGDVRAELCSTRRGQEEIRSHECPARQPKHQAGLGPRFYIGEIARSAPAEARYLTADEVS